MDTQEGNTGATPTAGNTIYDAAARIRELREGRQSPPVNAGTGDEGNQASATSGSAGEPDDTVLIEEPTGDGTGTTVDDGIDGDGGKPPPPDGDGTDARDDNGFALDSWKPEELDRKVKLKVNGEAVETTLREALRGHMRQQDYTRKTEEVNRTRDSYIEKRDRYGEVLAVLEPIVEQSLGGRTDAEWNQLRLDDPQAYLLEREAFAQKKQQLEATRAERQRIAAEQQQQFVAKHVERLQDEAEKFDRAFNIKPGDTATRLKIVKENCDYLRGMGMTDADINQIFDHRAFVLIEKARKYDAAVAAKKAADAKQVGTQQPMKPGGGAQVQNARVTGKEIEAKKAMSELKRTGSISDAARAIAAQREANAKRR